MREKTRGRILPEALVLVVVVVGACSGVKVRTDYEPGTDFSAYRTYAWLPPTPTVDASELLIERVRRAVDEELAARGMEKVAEEDAALRISERVSVVEKIQVNDPYYAYNQFDTYEEGTLLIDFVDAATHKLVWRGTGQSRLRDYKTPEERDQRVQEVVRAILKKYPPE
jgi:hypothetical protein